MINIHEYLLSKNNNKVSDNDYPDNGFPFFIKIHPKADDIQEIIKFLRDKGFEELDYDGTGIYKNHISTQMYDKIQNKGSKLENNYFMYGIFYSYSFVMFCSNQWVIDRKNLFEVHINEMSNHTTFKIDNDEYKSYEIASFKTNVDKYFGW